MGKKDRAVEAKLKRDKRKRKKLGKVALEESLKREASVAKSVAVQAVSEKEKVEKAATDFAKRAKEFREEVIRLKESIFNKSVELEDSLLEIDILKGYLDEARNHGDSIEAELSVVREKMNGLRKELQLYKTNPPPPDTVRSAFAAFNKLRKIGFDRTEEGRKQAETLTKRVIRWLEDHEKAFRAQT